METVAVVPVYEHAVMLPSTIDQIKAFGLPVMVVNDGSSEDVSAFIANTCRKQNCYLIERPLNGGKGAAVSDGLIVAHQKGYTHAFQVDADGQHNIDALSDFLSVSKANRNSLILGKPEYDHSVPMGRKMARWMTHTWIWINTLSFSIVDSMCGFRIYPLRSIVPILKRNHCGKRMDFDPEICVRACWENIPIINLPVKVIYPEDGVSNFRLFEDNFLITKMHTKLFFGMIIRFPRLIFQRAIVRPKRISN